MSIGSSKSHVDVAKKHMNILGVVEGFVLKNPSPIGLVFDQRCCEADLFDDDENR